MRLLRLPLIGLLILNLAIAATAAYVVAQQRGNEEEKARIIAANLAHLVTQDVQNEYAKVDIALKTVADDHAHFAALGPAVLEDWLEKIRARHPGLDHLSLADTDGNIVQAPGHLGTKSVNIADRPLFRRLRDDPGAGLQVSEAITGRLTHKAVVVLGRRLHDAQGKFNGTAVASIPIDNFRQQFASLKLGPRDSVTLRDPQRKIVARMPQRPEVGEIDPAPVSLNFGTALARSPDRGFFESGPGSIDGTNRSHAYLRDPTYGFIVSVGLARDDYLVDWRAAARVTWSLVAAFAVLSFLLAMYLNRAWQREKSVINDLKASEARFRAFFDNARVGMAITGPDKRWLMVNPALCSFFGLSREELMARTWADLTHPDDVAINLDLLDRVAAGEIDGYDMEKRYLHPDGRIINAFVASRAVRHADGGIDFFSSIIVDIDERKLAERRMRDTLAMFSRFLDHFPGFAALKDENRRVLLANRRFHSVLGLDPEAMIGKTARELFPGPLGEKIEADDERVLASGVTEVVEDKHGARIFETHKFAIDDEDGKRMLGAITIDITMKHRVADRYRALVAINAIGEGVGQKAFLSTGIGLAEHLTASHVAFLCLVDNDQQGVVLETWTAGAFAGGYPPAERRTPVGDVGVLADSIRRQQPVVVNECVAGMNEIRLADDHVPLTRLISVPVSDAGRVRMILVVANKDDNYDEFDIGTLQLIGNDLWRIAWRMRLETQLRDELDTSRELNRKLEQAQSQLLQSEKMAAIGQLAAGVAHELNNPIGFVQSNLGTLEGYIDDLLEVLEHCEHCAANCPDPTTQGEFLRLRECKDIGFIKDDVRLLLAESKDGSDRVRRIVQNLKDFSHVSENEWSWADLHKGLDSTLTIVWHELKYKAEIEKRYGTLPEVCCMPAQINQVFLNLLVNAAQAIEERGKILIATGCVEDRVWIEIGDTGKGIPQENISRIFEPFFTTKPVGTGTGLGLSLAYGIVSKHHGRISVDSRLGIGTTFRIELPLNRPLQPDPPT